jgi:hypothetical protein
VRVISTYKRAEASNFCLSLLVRPYCPHGSNSPLMSAVGAKSAENWKALRSAGKALTESVFSFIVGRSTLDFYRK